MRALAFALFFTGLLAVRAESELRLNQTRFGHAAAIVDDDIYIFGGYGNAGFSDLIEQIPADRSGVRVVGQYPHPRYWVNAATDGNHVYLVGGVGTSDEEDETNSNARVERWTPSTGEWKTLAPLPEPRAHVGLAWHAGKLYAIGGHAKKGRVGRVDIYDPVSDTWTRGADMPTARETDVVLHEGRIYAAGGYDGKASVSAFEVYDPDADTWMKLPDIPFLLSAHKVAVVDNVLYTFGHYHARDRVTAYDFATGEWSILDLPYKAARHTDVVYDEREVFVIGGNTRSGPPYLDLVQRFTREQLAAAPRRAPDERIAKEDAPFRPWKPAPEVQAILHAWTGALARIQTADISFTLTHRMAGVEGEKPLEMAFRFDRNGPRILFETFGMLFVLDGTNMTAAIRGRNRYMMHPQSDPPDTRSDIFRNMMLFLQIAPELQALIAEDPLDQLRQTAELIRLERINEAEDAQPGDWILEGRTQSKGQEALTRFIVDPQTGLSRRQVTTMQIPLNDAEDSSEVEFTMTMSPDVVKLNEALPPEAFAFTPGQNWKRVERFRTLWGESRSADRFALAGKPAPDFSLKLLDGEIFTLSAHTGKVVILDFWATWCGPCVRALPEMQKFWDAVRTQDVVVVGVSTDDPDNEDAVRRMAKREKLTYPVGIDRDNIDTAYGVRGIPTLVLIDRNGIVQGRQIGFSADMKKQLREQTDKMLAGKSLLSAVSMEENEDEDE